MVRGGCDLLDTQKSCYFLHAIRDELFYERNNSGYAIKPKKTVNDKHQNTVEYIAGRSFLFISFKKK